MKPSSSHAQFDSKVSQALPPNCKHCSANWLQRWGHSGEQQTNHSQLEKGSGSISEKFRTRRHSLKCSLIEDYPLRFMLSVYESVDDAVHTNNQTEFIERNWYETRSVGEQGVWTPRCYAAQFGSFLRASVLGLLYPWRLDRQVVPKRRLITTSLRRVTSPKREHILRG